MNADHQVHRASSARIGMLTPLSNTAPEPETQALIAPLGEGASVHFGRFKVTRIALDQIVDSQVAQMPILAAADLSGVQRLGLVTPGTDDLQAATACNYAAQGIVVVAEAHEGLQDNYSFAEVTEGRGAAQCRAVAAARPEAIAIVCTNMRGACCAAAVAAKLGIPIPASVAVTLWGCLIRAGVPTEPLRPFGRLFALSPRRQSAA